MLIKNPFGENYSDLKLPNNTCVIRMPEVKVLENPKQQIESSLLFPIASQPLLSIAKEKVLKPKNQIPKASIVISDHTRPVPYKGESGLLLPIINTLKEAGFKEENITIIIANGTHRPMSEDEINQIIDPRILQMKCPIINHDCKDETNLSFVGFTSRGTKVLVNSIYLNSDLKITTGLVESHFMAGASGGRKSICPGLIGEDSTFIFHGPELMANPNSRDLVIEGNPVHQESLEVAKMVGVDFIVNVTLNSEFKITGVFSGDLEKAHLAAVDKVKESVQVKIQTPVDIVVTPAGFVGRNHYQCAKCAVASLGILKENGYLIILANLTDANEIIGSQNYKKAIALLKDKGPKAFLKTITSSSWSFLPDQWQVQQWAKVFERIPFDHLIFASPQLTNDQWSILPGINGAQYRAQSKDFFTVSLNQAFVNIKANDQKMNIAYIADGPYIVPTIASNKK